MRAEGRDVVRGRREVAVQSVTPDITKILGLKKFQGALIPDVVLINFHP
jgi:S1-C subfamily serine protease